MPDTHQIGAGRRLALARIPTRADEYAKDRDAAEAEFHDLRDRLIDWQPRLYAEGRRKLLVVLQAMDAGGKDGTIRHCFKGVNPQGVAVTSFKQPSSRELAHDFLWRIHRAVPAAGKIGVFNRSHYEDVVAVRVHDLVPKSVWRRRFDLINDFERMLTETGTTILKFYLHISPGEQKERFQDRLDKPHKHWKFSHGDLDKRRHWDDYMEAYEEALGRCSTEQAPWHVIPADQKWYRNLAIMRVLVDTMERMAPDYPTPEEDLSQVTID